MRPSSIKYDPYKSLDEIAADSGVTVNAVRSYIKTHNIDRKFDDETIRHRRVTAYMRDHCGATIPQIANELGMAVGTVRKYACAKFTTQLSKGKISMLEDTSGPLF
ncbi:MAG: hypothetical protein K2K77_05240, partial [Duncaniella sp.]|nr:hypothetical protein [Duncaniella sp.]